MRNGRTGRQHVGKNFVNSRKFSTATAGIIFLIHAWIACVMFMKSGQSPVYMRFGGIFLLLSLPYLNAFLTKRFVLYEAIFIYFVGLLMNYTTVLLLPEKDLRAIDWEIWDACTFIFYL